MPDNLSQRLLSAIAEEARKPETIAKLRKVIDDAEAENELSPAEAQQRRAQIDELEARSTAP